MKLIVPMAGRGSRFSGTDYRVPKPLIQVEGKPMLHWAMRGISDIPCSQVIVIALKEHQEFGVIDVIREVSGNAEIILLPDVTQGQLCTVMTARNFINTDEDILIASADTFVRSSLGEHIANRRPDTHGIISVAEMPGDRWSFARVDTTGSVIEVAEKVRISDYASTGLYYFSNGCEFVRFADEIILQQEMIRGEYYVIPVYQKYIEQNLRIEVSSAWEMHDMGTPDALLRFRNHLLEQGVG